MAFLRTFHKIPQKIRWEGCTPLFFPKRLPPPQSDLDVFRAVQGGTLKLFDIEKLVKNKTRAVRLRREIVEDHRPKVLDDLPYEHYNYDTVFGQCCENVIGYVPIPVGVVGPLRVDGVTHMVPMATTEGALVASTARGCKALTLSGGVTTVVTKDGMSRAPVLQCPDITTAYHVTEYTRDHFDLLATAFNATSNFARLSSISCHCAGRKLFVRFTCTTGDAMGMNMVGKGTEAALRILQDRFPDVRVLALSGNVCTDKKPSALNWITGRGKSVVAECTIPGTILQEVLHTSVAALVQAQRVEKPCG